MRGHGGHGGHRQRRRLLRVQALRHRGPVLQHGEVGGSGTWKPRPVPRIRAHGRSASIGGVRAILADNSPPHAITVRVGPGQRKPNLEAHLEVFADNWAGGVRTPGEAPHLGLDEPTLLIGALVGACHAAAALFRHARLPEADPASVWHDAWTQRLSRLADAAASTGPTAIRLLLDELSLAGMGAVGNASALTHPGAVGTLRAADYDHVDLTNLNRCLLFVRDDLDRLKADVANAAAAQLDRPGVTLQVAAERAETAFGNAAVTTLVSAVDTNRARGAIKPARAAPDARRQHLATSLADERVHRARPVPAVLQPA